MPIYFSEVAPNCPLSTDSSTGPRQRYLFNRDLYSRATIPLAYDLISAILAANIARNIVTSLTVDKVINNVKQQAGGGKISIKPDKFKNNRSRWKEVKNLRLRQKYKYNVKDVEGNPNKLAYVITERFERMVWYDKAWKSYLIFNYGDKGDDGKPTGKLREG